jgi:hypothetical protein
LRYVVSVPRYNSAAFWHCTKFGICFSVVELHGWFLFRGCTLPSRIDSDTNFSQWHNGWLAKQGRSLTCGGPSLCPGIEEDVAYIEDVTRKAAIFLEERREEAAKEKARLRREPQEEGRSEEEKEKNRVEREQEELTILLHNRKMRVERKEKKRQGTLERARPRTAWEFPIIQGLGNQALVKATNDTNGPAISQATVGDASESVAQSRVGVK